MNKVKITLVIGEEESINVYDANISGNKITYIEEKDGAADKTVISVHEDGVEVTRTGNLSFRQTYKEGHHDKSVVTTEGQSFLLELMTNKITIMNGIIDIEYDIIQDSEKEARRLIINY